MISKEESSKTEGTVYNQTIDGVEFSDILSGLKRFWVQMVFTDSLEMSYQAGDSLVFFEKKVEGGITSRRLLCKILFVESLRNPRYTHNILSLEVIEGEGI